MPLVGRHGLRQSKADEQEETLEGRAATDIRAPRQLVWELIKPAESAPLIEPTVTRAFRAEGTPTGVGEIQVFIHTLGGKEQVTAVEIISIVPLLTSSFGSTDSTDRLAV